MSTKRSQGPWLYRFFVHLLTLFLGILSFWLLGFVLNDISHLPGPEYQTLEEKMLAPELKQEKDQLEKQLEEVGLNIEVQQERQKNVRDSTQNAQTTMNQLLEFQRLSLEKSVTPTEQEQLALAESQKQFLVNQTRYQQLNEEVSQLQEQRQELERKQRQNQTQLEEANIPIREEFDRLQRRHDYQLAAIKLAVLLPLLIIAGILFLKNRESVYLPLITAVGIAITIKVMVVMHEHFPTRYFKYVLILALIVIVTRALISLVRMIAFPKREFLLKQYRESYEAHLCPICEYPIRRGPLKYLYWTRRTINKLKVSSPGGVEQDAPYSCPSCGTRLFEECESCHQVRHSLLTNCEHCGTVKSIGLENRSEET